MRHVLVLTGATGSGKTELSERLAPKINAEIINADASQVRKGLDIGTAKTRWRTYPVRHHLFDIISPLDQFSVADYQRLAREKIEEIEARHKLPFLVGGTGLYISSVLYSYDFSSPARDPQFALSLSDVSDEELLKRLEEAYPEGTPETDCYNRRRIIRLLEKKNLGSQAPRSRVLLYDTLVIALHLPREELYARINKRTIAMVDRGWLEEVKELASLGVDVHQILEIGYPEIALVNEGRLSQAEAIEEIQLQTRHYAKRQETWFKNQLKAHFVERDGHEEETILKLIHDWER